MCECAMMMKDYFPSCSQFSALEPTEGPVVQFQFQGILSAFPKTDGNFQELNTDLDLIRSEQGKLFSSSSSSLVLFSFPPHTLGLHLDHRDGTNLRRCERRRTRASNNTMTTTPTISYLSGRWCTPSPLLRSPSLRRRVCR